MKISLAMIPRLPIQHKEATIQVMLTNPSSEEKEFFLSLSVDNTVSISSEKKYTIAGNNTICAELPWTPETNGWKKLTLTASNTQKEETLSSSLTVPVIAKPLYFSWFGPDTTLLYANLPHANTKEEQEEWKKKGARPWVWKGAKEGNTPQEYADYLYAELEENGATAIHIDEIGGYSDTEISKRVQMEGIRLFKKLHPEIFLGLYVCGSLKPVVAHLGSYGKNQVVDLLLLEAYLNYQVPGFHSYTRYAYFDQRINTARDYDALENSIMILGIKGEEEKYRISKEDLEEQVRYIRTHAPEMPGIGFYRVPCLTKEISEFADSLCLTYFIQPVLTIWERDIFSSEGKIIAGEERTIHTIIHNIGGMDAHNVQVAFYEGDPLYGGTKIGRSIYLDTLPADKGIPLGRYPVEQRWVPKKSGHQEIFVEIIPDESTTLLNGRAKRSFFVYDKSK
ncbi:MAG: hypothetical protein WDA18_08205 [Candidatus Ratteibacteria bacterium]|jgi:hypothetical protein